MYVLLELSYSGIADASLVDEDGLVVPPDLVSWGAVLTPVAVRCSGVPDCEDAALLSPGWVETYESLLIPELPERPEELFQLEERVLARSRLPYVTELPLS